MHLEVFVRRNPPTLVNQEKKLYELFWTRKNTFWMLCGAQRNTENFQGFFVSDAQPVVIANIWFRGNYWYDVKHRYRRSQVLQNGPYNVCKKTIKSKKTNKTKKSLHSALWSAVKLYEELFWRSQNNEPWSNTSLISFYYSWRVWELSKAMNQF